VVTTPDIRIKDLTPGLMDEVQIYDRAVSSSEITQIYNNSYSSVPNLVADWKFDETSGTTAYDSANQNHIYCGGDCYEVYNQGAVVALAATPDVDSISLAGEAHAQARVIV